MAMASKMVRGIAAVSAALVSGSCLPRPEAPPHPAPHGPRAQLEVSGELIVDDHLPFEASPEDARAIVACLAHRTRRLDVLKTSGIALITIRQGDRVRTLTVESAGRVREDGRVYSLRDGDRLGEILRGYARAR